MNAISISNLTKEYGDFVAVDNLSLEIKEGELFALLGVNGAGKTTTLKMLSGLIKVTNGEAILLGNSIVTDPYAAKSELNISPQETAVAGNLSVMENLELVAGIYGQDNKAAKESVSRMLSEFGLDNVKNKKAKKLSGGMQRRLSIAMALITEPRILFLDEPTLGLDVIARHELWASIKNIKGKVTIILTTHYLEEVEELSDRIGVMANGKLVATGTAEELKEQTKADTFERAFISIVGGAM